MSTRSALSEPLRTHTATSATDSTRDSTPRKACTRRALYVPFGTRWQLERRSFATPRRRNPHGANSARRRGRNSAGAAGRGGRRPSVQHRMNESSSKSSAVVGQPETDLVSAGGPSGGVHCCMARRIATVNLQTWRTSTPGKTQPTQDLGDEPTRPQGGDVMSGGVCSHAASSAAPS